MRVSGNIHYLYMYDIGDINLTKLEKVFNKIPGFVELSYTKLTPKYVKITPPPLQIEFRKKKIDEKTYSTTLRIYSVGVITICFKTEFSEEFKKLLKPINEEKIRKTADEIVEKMMEELKECIIKTYPIEKEPEDYVIYVINETEKPSTGISFLKENRKEIAALLREESDVDVLSEEEIENALEKRISYYKNDLAVIGYANSLILTPQEEKNLLLAMELANIQLLEFRMYSRVLDEYIDNAYDDLKEILAPRTKLIFAPGKIVNTARKISNMRIEISDIIGNILNMSRFIGDWYTARIYSAISERLHLTEIQQEVLKKLNTLEDFYSMALDRVSSYQNIVLEALIVILIIVEIIILLPEYVKLW